MLQLWEYGHVVQFWSFHENKIHHFHLHGRKMNLSHVMEYRYLQNQCSRFCHFLPNSKTLLHAENVLICTVNSLSFHFYIIYNATWLTKFKFFQCQLQYSHDFHTADSNIVWTQLLYYCNATVVYMFFNSSINTMVLIFLMVDQFSKPGTLQ